MKVKTLSALAGLGGALILSSGADAAFVGSYTNLFTTVNAGGQNRDVYRVYMMFDNAGDTLTTIYGDADHPWTIDLHGSTPFNPAAGGNVPGNNYAVSSVPATQWDSYVTIGLAAGYTGDPGANLILSPGFPTFITAAGIPAQNNFAWTTPGPLPQGMAGNGIQHNGQWGVLVMQITIGAGQASPSGVLNLSYTTASGLDESLNVTGVSWGVPAPGALALLGVAGLVTSRRRRA